MKRQRLFATVLSVGLTLGMLSTAFAGTWQVDFNGWWYENEDGTCPADGWQWIDGDGDGYAECYYFNPQGYVVRNTSIDGYSVNTNGHWTVGSDVQLVRVGGTSAAQSTGSTQSQGKTYADIYRQYAAQYGETNVTSEVVEGSTDVEKTLKGVNFLGLCDLDGNGVEELLIGYTTPNTEEYAFCKYKFGLDAYTQTEAGAVLCGKIPEAEMWAGGESDCGIELRSKDGKIYIAGGSKGTGAGSVYHFYTLSDGALKETLSYEIFEEIKINGQVSNVAYENLWDGWNTLGYYYIYGFEADWNEEFDINATVNQINAVKAKLGV